MDEDGSVAPPSTMIARIKAFWRRVAFRISTITMADARSPFLVGVAVGGFVLFLLFFTLWAINQEAKYARRAEIRAEMDRMLKIIDAKAEAAAAVAHRESYQAVEKAARILRHHDLEAAIRTSEVAVLHLESEVRQWKRHRRETGAAADAQQTRELEALLQAAKLRMAQLRAELNRSHSNPEP